jgi:alanine-synthesizing transaminase
MTPERWTDPILPSARSERIRYAVRDVLLVAEDARRAGKELIHLNIGDPLQYDFETPPHIIEATHRAMLAQKNGYADSLGEKEAVAAIRREAKRKGIDNVREVFVGNGSSEAIEIALAALVNAGDDVLVPWPGYPLYDAVLAKLDVNGVPYHLDEQNDWQPDLATLEARMTPRTRALVLINPNNPTGSVCSRDTLLAIAAIARRHRAVIFADEIYDKLILDGEPHLSIAALAPDQPVITFNGLSKAYLVPGFRIGWGIVSGPEAAVGPYCAAIGKLLRARLSANHPEQYAIAPALDGPRTTSRGYGRSSAPAATSPARC